MTIKTILAAALLLLLAAPDAHAQRALKDDPGYFDLAEVSAMLQQESTLEVNISGALLRMVAEASRFEDDALADMLFNLKAIQVLGYSMDDRDAKSVRERVSAISSRMLTKGWERVVRVRDDEEQVDLLVLTNGDQIEGMLVFVVAPGDQETVFVNIVGEIRPEEIGRIGRRFRIEAIRDL